MTTKTHSTLSTLLLVAAFCAPLLAAATARDQITAGDALWNSGNPQSATPYYNAAKGLAEKSGDVSALLDLSARYLLLKDESNGWESFNYATSWAYWWGWKVADCSWCGGHPEYGKPWLQESVNYYNKTLTGIFTQMGTTAATKTLFQQRATWAANLLGPATPAPTGTNKAPVITSVSVSRTTLSHGRADSVRHPSPTNPDGLQTVAGFGNLFTVIAAQSNPLRISLGGDGNPVVASAVNLPSCFTLAVAEGVSDPDGNSTIVRWTRPLTGTLFAAVAIAAAGIKAGSELTTTELLNAYTANSIIWEAPPVGTLIQGNHMSGGKVTMEARAIDTPAASQKSLTSDPKSQVVDYAQTIRVDLVERCKQKNANGSFTIGVTANISGNFEPLGKTWFRFAFQGNNETIIVDKQAASQVNFDVTSKQAGVSARVTVSAGSLGRAVASNPSPFIRPLPAAPQSVGLDTFNSAGGTVEDAITVVVEHKNMCGGAVEISAGGLHSLARRADGTVMAWGDNTLGQLGDGKKEEFSATAVQVKLANGTPLANVTSIASGPYHNLAVVGATGQVFAWGSNATGQLGQGNTNPAQIANPVQVKLAGGTPLAGVVDVAAGDGYSLALTNTGQVFAWGRNESGQLGNGSTTLSSNPVAVTLASGAALGGVTAIAAGSTHALALTGAGTVLGWGYAGEGTHGLSIDLTTNSAYITRATPMLGVPANVAGIAAGLEFSLVRTTTFTVFAWGKNDSGQLGTEFAGVSLGRPMQVLNANKTPFTGAVAIAAGSQHSLALMTLFPGSFAESWGNNGSGQLGDDTRIAKSHPVPVKDLGTGILAISGCSGAFAQFIGQHTLALKFDGTVWAWGLGNRGQLGNNSRTDSGLPVQVMGL